MDFKRRLEEKITATYQAGHNDPTYSPFLKNFVHSKVTDLDELHSEFLPVKRFSLSNEGDRPFLDAVMSALNHSTFFFFCGLFARVAVMRIARAECPPLDAVMLRIPLTETNINSAIRIRQGLKSMELRSKSFRTSSNEIEGRSTDTGRLAELAESDDPTDRFRFVKLMSLEAICLAYRVAKRRNVPFLIKDWDEIAEFRIEMMTDAIFLGNYHFLGTPTQFISGTSQFSPESFIYKFFYPGIKHQIDEALKTSSGVVLSGSKLNTDELIQMLRIAEPYDLVGALRDLGLSGDHEKLEVEIEKLFDRYQAIYDEDLRGRQ